MKQVEALDQSDAGWLAGLAETSTSNVAAGCIGADEHDKCSYCLHARANIPFSAAAVSSVVDNPGLCAFRTDGDGGKDRSDAAIICTAFTHAAKWKKVGGKGSLKGMAKDAGELLHLEPGQRNSLSSAHADGPCTINQRDRHKTEQHPAIRRALTADAIHRSCQPRE